MNQEANEVRIKSTLKIIDHLVAKGYTLFSSVYLHTEFNEVIPKHTGFEVWSDSLFFTVPDKALILRVSLNYRGGANSSLGTIIFHFQLLAEAQSLFELNEQAKTANLDSEVISVQANVGYPKIPRFIAKGTLKHFPKLDWTNYFTENPDRWVRQVQGSQLTGPSFNPLAATVEISNWIQPMLAYVKAGKLLLPDRCGITRDTRFVDSERCMRERLNLRTLREIADFGKFL